jgi:hypothetical protein
VEAKQNKIVTLVLPVPGATSQIASRFDVVYHRVPQHQQQQEQYDVIKDKGLHGGHHSM